MIVVPLGCFLPFTAVALENKCFKSYRRKTEWMTHSSVCGKLIVVRVSPGVIASTVVFRQPAIQHKSRTKEKGGWEKKAGSKPNIAETYFPWNFLLSVVAAPLNKHPLIWKLVSLMCRIVMHCGCEVLLLGIIDIFSTIVGCNTC